MSSDRLICPACGSRHGPDATFCQRCALPLPTDGLSDDAPQAKRRIEKRYTEGELVKIAFGQNQADSELIQNVLLDAGIPSMLRRSGGFDVPDFLAAGPRDVMVPESGAAAAREVLGDKATGDLSAAQPNALKVFAWLIAAVALVALALILIDALS